VNDGLLQYDSCSDKNSDELDNSRVEALSS
jgi:hypothetical protein